MMMMRKMGCFMCCFHCHAVWVFQGVWLSLDPTGVCVSLRALQRVLMVSGALGRFVMTTCGGYVGDKVQPP